MDTTIADLQKSIAKTKRSDLRFSVRRCLELGLIDAMPVSQLAAVVPLSTFAEMRLSQFRAELQDAGLRAMCGTIPAKRGLPKTSRATRDAQVVTE